MLKFISVLSLLLVLAGPAVAGRIYIWTDEDGVKRFSETLPEGIDNYETAVSAATSEDDNEMRPGLKKLMDELEQKKQADDAREAVEAKQKAAEEKAKAEAENNVKAAAERARIQKEIEEVKKRALSPTFTQGMRDNLINELQKKMDAIE